MGKYLQIYEIKEIGDYCKNRCQKVIREYTNDNIEYNRGLYKGYMYGVSITQFFIKKNERVNSRVLYNTIKEQKQLMLYKFISQEQYKKGIIDALYDLMNYVSMK